MQMELLSALLFVLTVVRPPLGHLLNAPLTGAPPVSASELRFWPIEQDLSAGATQLVKLIRRAIRRSLRMLVWSAGRWLDWALETAIFSLVALIAPLLDASLLRIGRRNGLRAVAASVALGLAVYIRLLFDGRSPMAGKLLLLLALAYAVANLDLVPDSIVPWGLLDDLVALAVAARCFMWMCPEPLVREHAYRAARMRERNLLGRPDRRNAVR